MNKNKANFKIINFKNHIDDIERKVEAVLFAAVEPLDINSINSIVKTSEIKIEKALLSLKKQYEKIKTKYFDIIGRRKYIILPQLIRWCRYLLYCQLERSLVLHNKLNYANWKGVSTTLILCPDPASMKEFHIISV